MLKINKLQTLGLTVLILAALFITISAVRTAAPATLNLNWPPRPDFSHLIDRAIIPVTSSTEGLAVYHRSEWGAPVAVQNSLELYYLSERVQANPANSVEAGLAQYYQSERGMSVALQTGLDIYHQSEWNAAQGSAAPVTRDQGAVDLSLPPRPDLSHLYEDSLIPVTSLVDFSDFHQRHAGLRASSGIAVDPSDYFMRHPELRSGPKEIGGSYENVEEARLYIMDSATRSYIARGEALEAARNAQDPAACASMTQEELLGAVDTTLDSATRSYIAWGLALQAKDKIGAACG